MFKKFFGKILGYFKKEERREVTIDYQNYTTSGTVSYVMTNPDSVTTTGIVFFPSETKIKKKR